MVCSVCGTQAGTGAKFCSGCGTAFVGYAAGYVPGRLMRPRYGRMIAGVCAGFAQRYGWDPIVVRLVLVLALFVGVGMPVLAYLIAWIIMPNAPLALPVRTGPMPFVTRLTTQSLAPRPFAYDDAGQLCCEGAPLAGLAEEFGTPLYCYSAGNIRARIQLLREAFAGTEHTLCYAVKANSSLAILRLLAEMGCGFDIVSGGELERIRRAAAHVAGAEGRVVFSGVGKQAWEMDAALLADGGRGILLFNVESEAELEMLAQRAQALGKTARIALRVNPDVFAETHPYISTGMREHKFGIALDQARMVYRRAATLPGLEPVGVSLHIGSQIREVQPFAEALGRARGLVEQLREDGLDIRFLDGGGGLGVEYGQAAFDPETTVQSYAAGLLDGLAEAKVHLLLEPGRFVVAQAGALVTRVLYTKQNGAKHFVITDAAMNDLIRPALYKAHHEIVPVALHDRESMVADVVGPVCESGDFFARDRELAEVRAGELVALLDAGAYGMSQSSQYNSRGRAAEVLVDGREAKLIRRRETVEDLLTAEML